MSIITAYELEKKKLKRKRITTHLLRVKMLITFYVLIH